jgi:hypothetical protein
MSGNFLLSFFTKGIFKRAGSGAASHEYGLGWFIKPREKSYAFCKDQFFYASHTGGAIGASSVLLIGSLIYISCLLAKNSVQFSSTDFSWVF